MQVILVKPVRKLGKVGEIVNIKDGFGRNYLIPQELAIRATKENIEYFSSKQKELEEKNLNVKKQAESIAKTLNGKHLIFVTQSAADGRLFGSVSAKDLAARISKMADYELDYSNIMLRSPIKFNGVYDVQVALHPEVITNLIVVVAKSELEAQNAYSEYKEEKDKSENKPSEEEAA